MEVESQKFDPAAFKLVWELKIKPMLGMTTDDAIVEENEGKLAQVLDVYEAQLEQSKYLAGDSFTLADLNHLPSVNYLMDSRTRKIFEARPRVASWCADILARPAWAKAIEMQEKQ
ncbi:hypothetical protein ACH5RR_010767 [Cinchona calisaya]|uniref:glutathione transferase n=1 Tax=Cinchona calisaya TaxID=153742 RepID=A0ABD3AJV1_9GENT